MAYGLREALFVFPLMARSFIAWLGRSFIAWPEATPEPAKRPQMTLTPSAATPVDLRWTLDIRGRHLQAGTQDTNESRIDVAPRALGQKSRSLTAICDQDKGVYRIGRSCGTEIPARDPASFLCGCVGDPTGCHNRSEAGRRRA